MVFVPLTTWQVVHRCFLARSSLACVGNVAAKVRAAAERINDFMRFLYREDLGIVPNNATRGRPLTARGRDSSGIMRSVSVVTPFDVLDFWFNQDRKVWFEKNAAFD